MLSSEKNLLVAGQSFFERAYARLPAHHERSHHVRKDDHVTNGHHRQFLALELFFGVRQLALPSLVSLLDIAVWRCLSATPVFD